MKRRETEGISRRTIKRVRKKEECFCDSGYDACDPMCDVGDTYEVCDYRCDVGNTCEVCDYRCDFGDTCVVCDSRCDVGDTCVVCDYRCDVGDSFCEIFDFRYDLEVRHPRCVLVMQV